MVRGRHVKSRSEFVKWWLAVLACLFMVVWGVYLVLEYGINSPAAIIGLGFEVSGLYLFSKTLGLRRYIWYGDLD